MKIEVIKPGVLVRNNLGMILHASSTVTLIQDGKNRIIVDTGLPSDRDMIIKALGDRGLNADAIDLVIEVDGAVGRFQLD